MDDLSIDQWVNVTASMLAFLACTGFAVLYHLRATWWRTEVGRNLMGFAAAVGLLCLYTLLITMWPEGCFAIVARSLRTLVLVAVAGLMVQRTRLFLRAQQDHHRRTGV